MGVRALFGLKTGMNKAFIIDEATRNAMVNRQPECAALLKPILFGRDVRRYHLREQKRFVIYCEPGCSIRQYPPIQSYLSKHRKALDKRAGRQKWFELQQPAVALLPHLARPKIVYPIIANECRFMLDESGYCINDKLFILPVDDKAVLAVLNSRVANFYFLAVCAALEGPSERYLEFRAQYVDPFPIPASLSKDAFRGRLSELAGRMLQACRHALRAKTGHEKDVIGRQIEATDREIDRLVYELYALSEEEIAIVEEGTR